jgi:hypothetical protein
MTQKTKEREKERDGWMMLARVKKKEKAAGTNWSVRHGFPDGKKKR